MKSYKVAMTLLITVVAVIVTFSIFWTFGGIYWLETRVFPPKRLANMPESSVWIDAPALPISWHHGWWFGCEMSSSGTANYCRLVMANGEEVYAGEYLPCGGK